MAVPSGRVENEVDILHYGAVVWRYRWLIVGLCAAAVFTTLVITLQMPKVYEARTTLLVPREGSGGGLLSSIAASGLLQQLPGISVPSLAPNRDVLLSVLKSRILAQAVVERFKLQERYESKFLEDAISALQAAMSVTITPEGVISVKVEETDPVVAADIANFLVEHLDRLMAKFGSGDASRQKMFIAEQLARSKADLEKAEDGLRRFQERNKAIVLSEQTRGAIEAAARLKGEIMASEVQLQVMRNFATDSNPEVISIKRRLDEMKRQLTQMQYGENIDRRASRSGSRGDISVPFAKVPELGLELTRQSRDVKVQETLVALLSQQFEQVRIAEAQDMPLVRVLDRAVPAVRHSKPRLRLNLVIAGVVSLFVGVTLSFFMEYTRNLRSRGVPV